MSNELPKGNTRVKFDLIVSKEKFDEFSELVDTMRDFLGTGATITYKTLGEKAAKTRQEITEVLKPLISQPGFVRGSMAWDICRRHGFGYGTTSTAFREIMNKMVEEGKAKKTDTKGKWEIF